MLASICVIEKEEQLCCIFCKLGGFALNLELFV